MSFNTFKWKVIQRLSSFWINCSSILGRILYSYWPNFSQMTANYLVYNTSSVLEKNHCRTNAAKTYIDRVPSSVMSHKTMVVLCLLCTNMINMLWNVFTFTQGSFSMKMWLFTKSCWESRNKVNFGPVQWLRIIHSWGSTQSLDTLGLHPCELLALTNSKSCIILQSHLD